MHPGAMKIGHWKLVNNLLRFIEALWRRKGITPIRRPEKLFPDKVTAAGASWSIFRLGFMWSAVSECGVRDCLFFLLGEWRWSMLKWSLSFYPCTDAWSEECKNNSHIFATLEFMSKRGVHECPRYTPIEYSWVPIRCWLEQFIPAPKQRMPL